jgi:protein-tyrosine-phosphatase
MSGGQDIADPWQGSIESYNKMAGSVIKYTNEWAEFFKMEIVK